MTCQDIKWFVEGVNHGVLKKSTEEPHLGSQGEINKVRSDNIVGMVCKTMESLREIKPLG